MNNEEILAWVTRSFLMILLIVAIDSLKSMSQSMDKIEKSAAALEAEIGEIEKVLNKGNFK